MEAKRPPIGGLFFYEIHLTHNVYDPPAPKGERDSDPFMVWRSMLSLMIAASAISKKERIQLITERIYKVTETFPL